MRTNKFFFIFLLVSAHHCFSKEMETTVRNNIEIVFDAEISDLANTIADKFQEKFDLLIVQTYEEMHKSPFFLFINNLSNYWALVDDKIVKVCDNQIVIEVLNGAASNTFQSALNMWNAIGKQQVRVYIWDRDVLKQKVLSGQHALNVKYNENDGTFYVPFDFSLKLDADGKPHVNELIVNIPLPLVTNDYPEFGNILSHRCLSVFKQISIDSVKALDYPSVFLILKKMCELRLSLDNEIIPNWVISGIAQHIALEIMQGKAGSIPLEPDCENEFQNMELINWCDDLPDQLLTQNGIEKLSLLLIRDLCSGNNIQFLIDNFRQMNSRADFIQFLHKKFGEEINEYIYQMNLRANQQQ